MSSKKYKGKPCVYCQENESIAQGDHVFFRKLFLEEERKNLIKVPACDYCNTEKSKLEHYLANILGFGGRHPDAKENLESLIPPRLEKIRNLQKK